MLRKRKCFIISLFIIVFTYVSASNAYAQTVTIGDGATLDIGSGTLNTGNVSIRGDGVCAIPGDCGELEATTGAINVSGYWANNGTFTAGTGTVNFIDGVSLVSITGESQFYNLSAITSGGKTLVFESEMTQTVVNDITLQGAPGNLLVLRSDEVERAEINLQAGATQTIIYVDVADHWATGEVIASGATASFNSVDSGRNLFWFDSDADGLSFDDELANFTDPDDPDSDDDGLSDADEVLVYLTDPNDPDSDGDHVSDFDEIFVYFTDPNNILKHPPDLDGDGYPEVVDNCPGVPNPDQANNDGDDKGDVCDPDDDSDSILDGEDNCQFVWNFEQINSDGDTFGDLCDNCPQDTNEDQLDIDPEDGFGDVCGPIFGGGGRPPKDDDPPADTDFLDNDKDGLTNGLETAMLTDLNDSDTDNDGVSDGDKTDPNGDFNGGVPVLIAGPDKCPLVANNDQADTDGDGEGDACDDDIDGDGVLNASDNCPDVSNSIDVATGSQSNIDDDTFGDACDDDADGDGFDSVASGGDDCNDLNDEVNPDIEADLLTNGTGSGPPDGLEDIAGNYFNNQLDDDCNSMTFDALWGIDEFVLLDQSFNNIILDEWEPTDGATTGDRVTIIAGDVINLQGSSTLFEILGPFEFDITFDSDNNGVIELPDERHMTNEQGRYQNDASTTPGFTAADDDFEIDDVGNPSFPYTGIGAGNEITLIPRDYGGSIKIEASVWIRIDDDNNGLDSGDPLQLLTKVIEMPKDSDNDGLPDFWENLYGDLQPGDDLETSVGNQFPGDDSLVYEEYRGFVWDPREDQTVIIPIDPPNETYQTTAFIPAGNGAIPNIRHFRTNPNRKDLFVKYSGFDSAHPFAIGAAFEVAGIDPHAIRFIHADDNDIGESNIDVLNITNDPVNVYSGSGHIRKKTGRRSYRQWDFSRKGMCDNLGDENAFATNCKTFQKALDFYFIDVPYLENGSVDMAGQPSETLDFPPHLNPLKLNGVEITEDQDDDGEFANNEDNNNNDSFDGDRYLLPPTFSADLSVFNIDGDNTIMVELPLFTDPDDPEISDNEYTLEQVLKHTITHELLHGVGCDHSQNGGACMYEFSSSWNRDGIVSPIALSQIQINHTPQN